MSLEKQIEALTLAVNNNTAALIGKPVVAGTTVQQATKAAEKVAEATKGPLSYDDVKGPFLALVKLNRDAALAAIAPLGNLKEAKPEQYAAILAKVRKATTDAEAAA